MLSHQYSAIAYVLMGIKSQRGNDHLLIRREEKPDEPYYTLEIKPEGKFIQCRGEHNCNMTPEVEAFKDMVVAEFNRRLKRKERKAA